MKRFLLFGLLISALAIPTAAEGLTVETQEHFIAGAPINVPVTVEIEAPIFSVTIPTCLPAQWSEEHGLTVADAAEIYNDSNLAVKVSSIRLEPINGWSLGSYDSALSEFQVAMSINEAMTSDGTFSMDDFNVEKKASYIIDYDVQVSEDSIFTVNTDVAKVVFIVGWAD